LTKIISLLHGEDGSAFSLYINNLKIMAVAQEVSDDPKDLLMTDYGDSQSLLKSEKQ
jgi:hypothetical protein